MRTLGTVALVLVIIGGLNWLLVGLFEYDLVASLFGANSVLAKIVYILVGLSALWMLWDLLGRRSRTTTTTTAA